ncbi:hypothetical protein CSA17_00495 [bacterium DOLJORAL78_65_58]|nr:MAG: hypothetical protein CSB20_09475 [bacterium DOLZORAL124_64_63]PIE76762.1 MAG: hypothetical protein CSA17_00495 [bacterium DOLJORAL78_65_58]
MENKHLSDVERETLKESLRELGIQDLEERLEVSSLASASSLLVDGPGTFDAPGDGCCGGKCNNIGLPNISSLFGGNDS